MTIRHILDELSAVERYHANALRRVRALREKIVAECSAAKAAQEKGKKPCPAKHKV